MSNEENKIKDEELKPEAVEVEAEAVGTDADIDWNEDEAQEGEVLDEQEAKIAQLEAALLASEQRVKDQQDSVLRAKAEVENMRRRSEQEIDTARKYALHKFAEELLPVIDNLERAIQAADIENEAIKPIVEGVELTHKTFISTVLLRLSTTCYGCHQLAPDLGVSQQVSTMYPSKPALCSYNSPYCSMKYGIRRN